MSKHYYYIAGPWFTTEEEKTHNQIISLVRNDLLVRTGDIAIINPREYEVPHGNKMPNHEWGFEIYSHDIQCIDHCEVVFAILNGQYMDSGTAMEVGYARARGKRVVGIITNPKETYSCMVINACDTLVDLNFRTLEKTTISVK